MRSHHTLEVLQKRFWVFSFVFSSCDKMLGVWWRKICGGKGDFCTLGVFLLGLSAALRASLVGKFWMGSDSEIGFKWSLFSLSSGCLSCTVFLVLVVLICLILQCKNVHFEWCTRNVTGSVRGGDAAALHAFCWSWAWERGMSCIERSWEKSPTLGEGLLVKLSLAVCVFLSHQQGVKWQECLMLWSRFLPCLSGYSSLFNL